MNRAGLWAIKGRLYDDPHVETFDGHKYDCQGNGDFILSKSLISNRFELQGRFNKLDLSTGLTGTTTTAAVFKSGVSGEPTLEVESVPNTYDHYTCQLKYTIGGSKRG
jgi:von Willebrand factor type D domain